MEQNETTVFPAAEAYGALNLKLNLEGLRIVLHM